MDLNRRSFLTLGLKAAAAAIVAPAIVRSEVIMPVRSIWTPPSLTVEELLGAKAYLERGNRPLTIEEITRESLRILHQNLAYYRGPAPMPPLPKAQGQTIKIRMPTMYKTSASGKPERFRRQWRTRSSATSSCTHRARGLA